MKMWTKLRTTRRPMGAATLALLLLAATGCSDDDELYSPPTVPKGLYSVTADNAVILRWIPNDEPDLAGYLILSNEDGGAEYYIIDTIDAFDPAYFVDNGTSDPGDDYMEYYDDTVSNGNYYWYAVAAFDHDGNESELSYETIVDVPRPEGVVTLADRVVSPATSGYDLSAIDGVAQPWDAPSTDVWFEYDGGGVPFLFVDSARVDIQDYGNVGFDVASFAPRDGWSRLGYSEAIAGHTYILRIFPTAARSSDPNYAKLTVVQFAGATCEMDWGYQVVVGERELLVGGDPPDSGEEG